MALEALDLHRLVPAAAHDLCQSMRIVLVRQLAHVVKRQIPLAPPSWKEAQWSRALEYERDARLLTARSNTLEAVIRRLKGTTSMVTLKVWCEGGTDKPVIQHLLSRVLEANSSGVVYDTVGGWPNLLGKAEEPQRFLDGCRGAFVIMDGDRGRNLRKKGKPLSKEGRKAERLLSKLPIRLCILERYGIENYFTRTALEEVLGGDLSIYFPIPDYLPVGEHFVEWRNSFWRWAITILREITKKNIHSRNDSFYRKGLNGEVASKIALDELMGTDLYRVLQNISERVKTLGE